MEKKAKRAKKRADKTKTKCVFSDFHAILCLLHEEHKFVPIHW